MLADTLLHSLYYLVFHRIAAIRQLLVPSMWLYAQCASLYVCTKLYLVESKEDIVTPFLFTNPKQA